jgi:bifunctional non-homologous end joining protein LigD
MKVISQVKLFFQEGSSDKVYHATLVAEADGSFSVEVEWGRRGSTLSTGRKANKVSRAAAEKAMARCLAEKTRKGYESMAERAPDAVAPPEGEGSGSRATGVRKKVGHRAQLLTAVEEDAVAALLADDRMIAQQKLDGSRVLVHVGDPMLATNRDGQATSVHPAVLDAAGNLPFGTVIDGEIVAGEGGPTYWVFDVLSIGDEDVRGHGYLARWTRIDEDLEAGFSGPLRLLECAHGKAKKKALHDRLRTAGCEGVVFKRKDAPYAAGRGTTQLKHKFVKSADVVLLENAGNAYRMAVYAGKALTTVGKVFSGTTSETRRAIDALLAAGKQPIAEVRYLYATDDDQLFQPVFVRLRTDKKPTACVLGQLARTSRDVHDV